MDCLDKLLSEPFDLGSSYPFIASFQYFSIGFLNNRPECRGLFASAPLLLIFTISRLFNSKIFIGLKVV